MNKSELKLKTIVNLHITIKQFPIINIYVYTFIKISIKYIYVCSLTLSYINLPP